MSYLTAYCTDMGAAGKKNQDALSIKTAAFMGNEYAMAAVCDGVGGLSEGEKASSYIIEMLSEWFEKDFSELLRKKADLSEIQKDLDENIHHFNDCLNSYAQSRGFLTATTLTAALFMPCKKKILIVNVGDTRCYRITDKSCEVLTNDHSVVGEKVRQGLLSEEKAGSDPRQNQITRCIGAGFKNTEYEYCITDYQEGNCYMLCTDGFRKKISSDEIMSAFSPAENISEEKLQRNTEYLTDLNLQRGETDNITAAVIKIK